MLTHLVKRLFDFAAVLYQKREYDKLIMRLSEVLKASEIILGDDDKLLIEGIHRLAQGRKENKSIQLDDILDKIVDPMAFLTVDILGLPKEVIIVLLFGFLRKEATLAMLVVILGTATMTPEQWFVFTLVVLFYVPCLATLSVMAKEFSKRETVYMVAGTLGLAILSGALANFIFTIT